MISRSLFNSFLLTLSLVGVLGCGNSPTQQNVLAGIVRGTVTLDGEPLSRGTLTFLPQHIRDGSIEPGFASIEPDGRFWVGNSNLSKPAGLEPGSYKVTVLVMEPRPEGADGPIARLAVPKIYTEESTTPFEFDIVAGQNRIRLDLKSE